MDKSLLRSFGFLGTAISAWSLSPFLIVKSRGIAPSPMIAVLAVSIGSIFAAVVVSRSRRLNIIYVWRSAIEHRTIASAAAVGIGAFVVYPLLYFSALQSGPPLLINLVNYMWPIIGLLLAAVRPANRSLEVLLAAGFGFAGAALAIFANNTPSNAASSWTPFVFAALGAISYGGVSAWVRLKEPGKAMGRLPFNLLTLWIGGAICLIIVAVALLLGNRPASAQILSGSGLALLVYSLLLPFAHLSWFMAIQDARVSAFASAYMVPVLSTAILAAVEIRTWQPEVLAALSLVLAGIALSSSHERGVPALFAVALAAMASVLISESFAMRVQVADKEALSTFLQVLVGLVAILSGFVFLNATARYNDVQRACSRFYAKVASLLAQNDTSALKDLDDLDRHVLGNRRIAPNPVDSATRDDMKLAQEWAEVELALSNSVSRYEWLTLSLASISMVFSLHAYSFAVNSTTVVILAAMATSVIVSVPFAVRDYDRNRPDRMPAVLKILRKRYRISLHPYSPLVDLKASTRSRANRMLLVTGRIILLSIALAAIIANWTPFQ